MTDVVAKPWYKSKTLGLNALAASLAAAESLTGVVKDVLAPHGPSFYIAFVILLAAANAALRSYTSQPIE